MSRDFDRRFHEDEELDEVRPRRPAPGKVSLTSRIGGDAPATPPTAAPARAVRGVVRMKRQPGSSGFGGAVASDMASVDLHAGSDAEHAGKAISGKGSGSPLPSSLASHFERAYGTSLGDVRVHTDSSAAVAASQTGSRAFTYGADIFFGSGQYNPGTSEGDRLIGHELAHVAQQGTAPQAKGEHGDRLLVGQVGDAQEREADAATDIALAGGTASLRRAGPAIRFDKQGGMGRGGHAQTTEEALMKGVVELTAEEAHRARMLNWMQDYNQVFQPKTQIFHLVEPLKPIMEILAIKEFGIGLDFAKMGTYDPVRHIDRPDQLKGSDVFDQRPVGPIKFDKSGLNEDDVSKGDLPLAGDEDTPYHKIDERYKNLPGFGEKDKVHNKSDDKAFQVNSAGMPAFIAASKEQTKGEFLESARRGTKGARKKDWNPEEKQLNGPELFALASHTLQDYPTHCNYVEVALNILIREGKGVVSTGAGKDETTTLGKKETLDTGIHKVGDKRKEGGHVKNYTIKVKVPKKDKSGKAIPGKFVTEEREVLTSGGFSIIDTAESLVAGLKDAVSGIDPMSDEEPTLTYAILDYIDKKGGTAGDFSNLGGIVKGTAGFINSLASLLPKAGSALIKGAGSMVKGASRVAAAPSGVASWGLGLMGDAARYVGADTVADIADTAKGAADTVNKGIKGLGDKAKAVADKVGKAIDKVVEKMDAMVEAINDQHMLVRLYKWMKEKMDGLVDGLIALVGKLPIVGPKAEKALKNMRKQLKSAIKQIITLAWNRVKATVLGLIENVSQKLAEERAKSDKEAAEKAAKGKRDPTRSKNLTDPGHSNISKDHADFWIEEMGEEGEEKTFKVRETTKKIWDPKKGEYRDPKKVEESDWLNEYAKDKFGVDTSLPKKEEEKTFDPKTLMQALSPLAHGIGVKMTKHVKAAVEKGWVQADAGKEVDTAPVAQAVDEVWTHPADNRGMWEGMATAFLANSSFGPALLKFMRGGGK